MSYQDELEECALIHFNELSVPRLDVIIQRLCGFVTFRCIVYLNVVLAVFDDLCKNFTGHVGQRNGVLLARVYATHPKMNYIRLEYCLEDPVHSGTNDAQWGMSIS